MPEYPFKSARTMDVRSYRPEWSADMEKFWDGLAAKLADRWAAVAPPALAFWLAAALAWSWGHQGFRNITSRLTSLGQYSAVAQCLIVVGCLLLITGSIGLVDRLTNMFLPVLAGNWPEWAEGVNRRLVERAGVQLKSLDSEWQELRLRAGEDENPSGADEFRDSELDERRRQYSMLERQLMPTRLGNILRGAESRPYVKYGLAVAVIMPRLWPVLPTSVRKDLTAAWLSVNVAASVIVWSLLLIPFTVWCPYVLIVSVIGVLMAWIWLPERAKAFGELLESAFDVYRMDLYRQLRWPLPIGTEDERAIGVALTRFLLRGPTGESIQYSNGSGAAK
jgi:hypothetical protein